MEKKAAAVAMNAARAEKEAAAAMNAARPTAAEMDNKSATEKAARMAVAARSQVRRDDVRRREEYMRRSGFTSIPTSVSVGVMDTVDDIDVDALLGLNRYGSSYQPGRSYYVC